MNYLEWPELQKMDLEHGMLKSLYRADWLKTVGNELVKYRVIINDLYTILEEPYVGEMDWPRWTDVAP
jgi:hypothetical protein